jgi:hypothetical protein
MFKFVIAALVAANVAASWDYWTIDSKKDMYYGTINANSKPDQGAGDFKMSQGGETW